ncbi:rhamnulokinase [Planctomicrobium sp. SH664]|uniref:rhamnulokinase n=1 Tax=Planctomicrobium sp. SH664 TaxID=3448125 RepID=UPI003F5C7D4F
MDLNVDAGRIVAGHWSGDQLQLTELHRFPISPVTWRGTLRWNLLGIWQEIQIGLAAAAQQFGKQVTSIGVQSWHRDYVLLTRQDERLGEAWSFEDSRSSGLPAHAATRLSQRDVAATTGRVIDERSTLYQLIAMQLRDPELLEQAQRLLLLPDYFHWLLCGSKVSELTNVSATQCFRWRTRDWAQDLLRRFDLPTRILPEIVPPGTHLGSLRSEVAQQAGVSRIDVITPVTWRTASALLATPTERTNVPGWAVLHFDQQAELALEIAQPVVGEETLKPGWSHAAGADGNWWLHRPVTGLRVWKAVHEAVCQAEKKPTDKQLARQIEKAAPWSQRVTVADLRDDEFPHRLQALREQPDPGPVLRSLLETLAFEVRRGLQQLEKIAGIQIGELHVIGPGAELPFLGPLLANGTGRTVFLGPAEAAAFGCCLMQARASGLIPSVEELRQVVRRSAPPLLFTGLSTSGLEEAWTRYRAAADALDVGRP